MLVGQTPRGRPDHSGKLDTHSLNDLHASLQELRAWHKAERLPPPTKADFLVHLGCGDRTLDRRLDDFKLTWTTFVAGP
jgi:hypothetical protein